MKRVVPLNTKEVGQMVNDTKKLKLTPKQRLEVFVDGFVLVLDGKRIPFNKQKKLPERFMLKMEGGEEVFGPLFQVWGEGLSATFAPAFKDKDGAVWLDGKTAKSLAVLAGLELEIF